MVGRMLAVVALLVGCRATDAFICASDPQCRHGTTPGRCESSGFCSFPDGMCASGSRYDDNADPMYAGKCVGDQEPPIDAMIDTPPPFDLTKCPPSYVQINSMRTTSRYDLVTAQGTYAQHASNCNNDLPGATHLVMPETAQELTELSQWIDPMSNTGALFWVGVVQAPNAFAPDNGWILLDDTQLAVEVWRSGEPNDADVTENGQEQFAYLDKSSTNRRMTDTPGSDGHGGVCECDGKAIGPMASAFVAAQQ
jgi:hypothetical protein